jgi:multicomponent Na+:H+ antiporter subunit C
MNADALFPVTAALLLAIGLYGLLSRTELIHRLIATNIMSSAVFLLLVRMAVRRQSPPDPVPHAMVLTGIVIAISLTAFALALTRRFRHLTHRSFLAEDKDAGDSNA